MLSSLLFLLLSLLFLLLPTTVHGSGRLCSHEAVANNLDDPDRKQEGIVQISYEQSPEFARRKLSGMAPSPPPAGVDINDNEKAAAKRDWPIISTLSFFLLAYSLFIYLEWRSLPDVAPDDDPMMEKIPTPPSVKRYRYSELKHITGSFTSKIGKGGYGIVFKGNLSDGTAVAVKMLSETKGTIEEFINEIASISRTNHVNIVTLLGFCSEDAKRALIYGYMPNGSLEKFLFLDDQRPAAPSLTWEQRHAIALGIAKGLEYLHRGCNSTPMVHFDIKPSNILLDEDLCPKISDFGLAKLHKPDRSILSTFIPRGTIGYIAPEVVSRNFGVPSSKSDVYSYGMMVLEMVGGRRNVNLEANMSESYFPHWIYEHLDEECSLRTCGIPPGEEDLARKMILVGLWCIQASAASRPSIDQVVDMLNGSGENIGMPPKPYITSPERPIFYLDVHSTTSFSSLFTNV